MKTNEVNKWLFEVQHPAKGDKNVVELGMVENIEIQDNKVTVTLAFSKHRDPLAEYLIGSTKAAIIRNAPQGTQVEVKTVVKEEAPKKEAAKTINTRKKMIFGSQCVASQLKMSAVTASPPMSLVTRISTAIGTV